MVEQNPSKECVNWFYRGRLEEFVRTIESLDNGGVLNHSDAINERYGITRAISGSGCPDKCEACYSIGMALAVNVELAVIEV